MSVDLPGLDPGLTKALVALPVKAFSQLNQLRLHAQDRLRKMANYQRNHLMITSAVLFDAGNRVNHPSTDDQRRIEIDTPKRTERELAAPDISAWVTGVIQRATVRHHSSPSFDARSGAGHTASVGEAPGPAGDTGPGAASCGGAR